MAQPKGRGPQRAGFPAGRQPDRPFEPFREVEIFWAIHALVSDKAPGLGAIPAEGYK